MNTSKLLLVKNKPITSSISSLTTNKPIKKIISKQSDTINNNLNEKKPEINICKLCDRERNMEDLTSVHEKGNITYICEDVKDCKSNNKKIQKKIDEEKRIKELREKYKHLDKEEQLKEIYGVDFDDLDELPERYRDASIHYIHKETGKKYKWTWAGNYWY